MPRKALQVLAVIAALISTTFSAVPATAAVCTTGGSGSAGDPYVICDTTDFNQISGHPAWHFKLGANLDFAGYNPPTTNLNGELDGNGKTISNFTRTITTNYGGLFRYINYTGYIHDLKLDNVHFDVNNGLYAAPFAGILYGRAERIQASGAINTDSQYTTGLVGIIWGDATLSNSVSSVTINRSQATYAYGLSGLLWGGDPQQGGDGIPQVSNSFYLGSGNLWALPEYSPYFDPQQGGSFPTPSCEVVVGVFSLADDIQTSGGCGVQSNFDAIAESNTQTNGYSSFSEDVWNFGDSTSLPLLDEFPQAPGSPRGLSVRNNDGVLIGQVVPGFNGGSAVTSYDVEVRRVGGAWHAYTGQFLESTLFQVTSLTQGVYYDVRIRAVNASGAGDWLASTESIMFGDNAGEIQVRNGKILTAATGLLEAPQVSSVVALPNGLWALAYSNAATNGSSLIGLKIFNSSGRVTYESNVEAFSALDSKALVMGDGSLSLAVSPKGTLAIGYVVKTTVGNNVTTTVKVREFSSVLLEDETVLPDRTIDKTSSACNNDANCGYENIQLVSDVAGNFAAIATYPTVSGDNLVAASQGGYRNWQTASLEAAAAVESVSIVPGKAGLLVGWVNRGSTSVAKYSILKKSGTTTWSASAVIDSQAGTLGGKWVKRSASLASFVWYANLSNADVIKVRDFDLAKFKFPKVASTVVSPSNVVRSLSASSSLLGEVSIAWDEKARDTNSHSIKTVTLPASNVAGTPATFGAYIGSDYSDLTVTNSTNGTPLVTWARNTQDGSQVFVAAKSASGFNVRELPGMSPSASQPRVNFLPAGDVIYVSVGTSGTKKLIEMNTILTGKAPELSSAPTLAGEAKVGKTLTATFGSWYSYTAVSKQSMQWWRCPANFAGYLDQLYGCTPIAGATKATYKATKADKGKTLGFTMDATNTVGKSSASIAFNGTIG